MPFTVEVSFTGIVSFVKHPSGTGYRALIPDTLFGNYLSGVFKPDNSIIRRSLDGVADLRRHYPRLVIPVAKTPLVLLHREEIAFDFSFAGASPPLQIQDPDFESIISMSRIGAGLIEASIKDNPTRHAYAGSHVDLQVGSLRTTLLSYWSIPGTLRPGGLEDQPYVGCFAHMAVWTVPNVHRLNLRFPSYASGTGDSQVFQGLNDNLRIDLMNHCGEPWRRQPDPGPRQRDIDFKWHYELLEGRAKASVQQVLAGKKTELPVPDPVPDNDCPDPLVFREDEDVILLSPPDGNCMMARWF